MKSADALLTKKSGAASLEKRFDASDPISPCPNRPDESFESLNKSSDFNEAVAELEALMSASVLPPLLSGTLKKSALVSEAPNKEAAASTLLIVAAVRCR